MLSVSSWVQQYIYAKTIFSYLENVHLAPKTLLLTFFTLSALQISLNSDPHLLLQFSSSQPFVNPQQSENSKIPLKVISDLLVPTFSWLLWDLSPWTFPPRASLRSSLMSLILPHSFVGTLFHFLVPRYDHCLWVNLLALYYWWRTLCDTPQNGSWHPPEL